jgi:uncharacterized protein
MVDTGDRGSSGKRKLFSLLCHGSIFLSFLVIPSAIPLAILILFDDPIIKATAKETLNYHFNIWLYGAIAAGLGSFFFATILLAPLAFVVGGLFSIFHWIPPIFGVLATLNNSDEPYRYPFIWRLL